MSDPIFISDSEDLFSDVCSTPKICQSEGEDRESSSDEMVFLSNSSSCDDFSDSKCSSNFSEVLPPVRSTSKPNGSLEEIGQILIKICCENKCLHNYSVNDVLKFRNPFKIMSVIEQRQWIFQKLNESCVLIDGKIKSNFVLAGKNLCKEGWCEILGISKRRLHRLLKSFASTGPMKVSHGNMGKKRYGSKSDNASAWMKRYFDLIGDHMPNTPQVHLPSWETQKEIYQRYLTDMEKQMIEKESVVSLRTFYRIWNDHYSHVVIPEENRFAKCDVCSKIKLERKESIEKNIQNELKLKHNDHLKRVELERKKYHSHREKARASPEKYLTIIIDGMDQAKTDLPHTKLVSKSTSGLWRLRTHLTGALVHTQSPHGKLAYCFVDLRQWPHDSNLTATIIYNVLLDFSQGHNLPEVLYLQMDNVFRENKNRYVFMFLSVLVELRIFRKVKVNFLPVGHTHEDIDQLFSRVSEELRQNGCECLPDLLKAIERSSTPTPKVALLEGIWNIKDMLSSQITIMENHSKYLNFKIILGATGKAELFYRRFSSMGWEPSNNKGLNLLSACPDACDKPELVAPNLEKLNLQTLFEALPKYKPWISSTAWAAWEEFISTANTLNKVPYLLWELQSLVSNAVTSSSSRKRQASHLSSEVARMLESETRPLKQIKVRLVQPVADVADGMSNSEEPDHFESQLEPSQSQLDLQPNKFVAVYLDKYKTEKPPYICEIQETLPSSLTVQWWTGSYSGMWKGCKIRQNNKTVPWIENIPLESVVSQATFTKTYRLQDKCKTHLKELYSKFE